MIHMSILILPALTVPGSWVEVVNLEISKLNEADTEHNIRFRLEMRNVRQMGRDAQGRIQSV